MKRAASEAQRRLDLPDNNVTTRSTSLIPEKPAWEGLYSLNGVTKQEVTARNHGLHKYPAKFVPHIPRWALQYGQPSGEMTVLDPFCGSGTTLIEAGLLGHKAIGVDINPLAVVITRAKTACLSGTSRDVAAFIDAVLSEAQQCWRRLSATLTKEIGEETLGIHRTWSNWFRPEELGKLIALRNSISKVSTDPALTSLSLACLSSVTKAASFLNEDQIKVRFDRSKQPADPFERLPNFLRTAFLRQVEASEIFRTQGAAFTVWHGSAAKLSVTDSSVDRIITSPPYINAVDYTMTHKYNLFVLGLLDPQHFVEHSRLYIGHSERAVRKHDLQAKPLANDAECQRVIDELWSDGTPVSRNRAVVVAQYFREMGTVFREFHRVLKPGGLAFFVVGEFNRIRGRQVPTADLLEHLANRAKLTTELRFFHEIANRSSMRLNRSATGGSITNERVYVFRR